MLHNVNYFIPLLWLLFAMVNEADIALPGSDDDYDEVTSTINDVTTDGSAAASMISAYFSLVDIRFLIQVTLT